MFIISCQFLLFFVWTFLRFHPKQEQMHYWKMPACFFEVYKHKSRTWQSKINYNPLLNDLWEDNIASHFPQKLNKVLRFWHVSIWGCEVHMGGCLTDSSLKSSGLCHCCFWGQRSDLLRTKNGISSRSRSTIDVLCQGYPLEFLNNVFFIPCYKLQFTCSLMGK